MANEDVIDMAAGRIARCRCRRTDEQCYDCRLFAGLAAALREARKERELIRTLAEQYKADPINAYDRPSSWGKLEALIDAAMKPPGGEDGA